MQYKEFLRARTALLWYVIVLAVTAAGIVIVASLSGSDQHVHVTAGTAAHPIPKTTALPWMIGYALASWVAAILATVLGSSLAQEEDHLALAWTKPHSRTEYATVLMGVDAICIIIAQVIAFGFIGALKLGLAHSAVRVVPGPDDTLNLVRFTLFPLAWYAVIIALSAGPRIKAGMVQGLIWPVSIGLAVVGVSALPAPWHQILAAANVINPLLYTGYHAGSVSSGIVVDTESGEFTVSAAMSTLALATFIVLGWFAATFQWRRLEA
jgi:hypothetical protein